ncbi:hypothetical protein EBZ70_13320 [bacterium]|nr:hypothetical protein [bacterium]
MRRGAQRLARRRQRLRLPGKRVEETGRNQQIPLAPHHQGAVRLVVVNKRGRAERVQQFGVSHRDSSQ